MDEEKKKTGLSKKISSIFDGIPEIKDKVAQGKDKESLEKKEGPELLEDKLTIAAKEVPPAAKEISPSELEVKETPEEEAIKILASEEQTAKRPTFDIRGLLKTKKLTLGVDIGAGSVRIVQLQSGAEGAWLVKFAFKEIPAALRGEGRELDRFIVETIRQSLREIKLDGPGAGCTVYGQQVSINLVGVGRVKKRELRNLVKSQIKETVPFDVDKSIFDFNIIDERAPGDRLDVLAVAVEEELVDRKVDLLQRSGLKPIGVGVIGYALENLIRMGAFIKDEIMAVVDIGASTSSINIFKGNLLQFARETTTGGDQITQSMVRRIATENGQKLNITLQDAEKIKREYGVPKENETGKTDNGLPLSQISAMVRPILERLVNEIKRSLSYYSQSSGEKRLDRILLTGGGSKLKNIGSFLTKGLGVKVEIFGLLDYIKIDAQISNQELLSNVAPNLTVAIGLALGRPRKINLLPLDIKIQNKMTLANFALKFTIPLIIFILMFFYASMHVQSIRYKHLLLKSRSSLTSLQPTLEKINYLEELKARIARREVLVGNAVGRQPLWEGILKEISNIIPDGMVLADISLIGDSTPKQIRFQGIIYATYSTIDITLSQFMVALDESPFFTKVELVFTQERKTSTEPSASFVIITQLVY